MHRLNPLHLSARARRWLAALLLLAVLAPVLSSLLSSTLGMSGSPLAMDLCSSSTADGGAADTDPLGSAHACCLSQCAPAAVLPAALTAALPLALPAMLVPALLLTGPRWRAVWSPASGRGPPR